MNHVVLCAYDEGAVIRQLILDLAKVLGPLGPARIVLVDDGSGDETVAEAEASRRGLDGGVSLDVLSHETNQGLGAALAAGFSHCLADARDDDVIITLDADATHRPEQIPTLLAALGPETDLVIASRYEPGARVTGIPLGRRMLSDAARVLLHRLLPIPGVRDYTCCFRAYRASLLLRARERWGAELSQQKGFAAVPDILFRLRALEPRAREIPLKMDYGPRVGHSKMRIFRNIRQILSLVTMRFLEARRHPERRLS